MRSGSLRTTWKARASQIDHCLMSPTNVFFYLDMKAIWSSIKSDHKLILITLKQNRMSILMPGNKTAPQKASSTKNNGGKNSETKHQWNTQNLKNDKLLLSYKKGLDSRLKAAKSKTDSDATTSIWDNIKQCIQTSATNILNHPTSSMTRRRGKAFE